MMNRTIMAAITAVAVMVGFQTLPPALDDRAVAYAELNDDMYHLPLAKEHASKHIPSATEINGKPMWPGERPVRQCSDTPKNAILTFLRGIDEFDLKLLRATVPEEISLFAVFGGGNVEDGRAVLRQILDHPEVRRGNEVDSTYVLLEMAEREDGGEKEVHIERRDRVFLTQEDMRDVEQVYRRAFLVRFDPQGNCILGVKPLGQDWSQIR